MTQNSKEQIREFIEYAQKKRRKEEEPKPIREGQK